MPEAGWPSDTLPAQLSGAVLPSLGVTLRLLPLASLPSGRSEGVSLKTVRPLRRKKGRRGAARPRGRGRARGSRADAGEEGGALT